MKNFLMTCFICLFVIGISACDGGGAGGDSNNGGGGANYGTVTITFPDGTKTFYANEELEIISGNSGVSTFWYDSDKWLEDFQFNLQVYPPSETSYYTTSGDLQVSYNDYRNDPTGDPIAYYSLTTKPFTVTVSKWEGSGGVFEGSFTGTLVLSTDHNDTMAVSGTFSIDIP